MRMTTVVTLASVAVIVAQLASLPGKAVPKMPTGATAQAVVPLGGAVSAAESGSGAAPLPVRPDTFLRPDAGFFPVLPGAQAPVGMPGNLKRLRYDRDPQEPLRWVTTSFHPRDPEPTSRPTRPPSAGLAWQA